MNIINKLRISLGISLVILSLSAKQAQTESIDGFPEGCSYASIYQALPGQYLRYGVIRWYDDFNSWVFLYINGRADEYMPVEIADNVGRLGQSSQSGLGDEFSYGTPRNRYVVAQILDRNDVGLNPIVTCISRVFVGQLRFGVEPYGQDYWTEYERYKSWKYDFLRRDNWLFRWKNYYGNYRRLWRDKFHRSDYRPVKPWRPISKLPSDDHRGRQPFRPGIRPGISPIDKDGDRGRSPRDDKDLRPGRPVQHPVQDDKNLKPGRQPGPEQDDKHPRPSRRPDDDSDGEKKTPTRQKVRVRDVDEGSKRAPRVRIQIQQDGRTEQKVRVRDADEGNKPAARVRIQVQQDGRTQQKVRVRDADDGNKPAARVRIQVQQDRGDREEVPRTRSVAKPQRTQRSQEDSDDRRRR